MDKSQPNVLVIMTDQHRVDAVSSLAGTVCRTPNIDRLAKGGISFTQAYSICALCTPARASMYTGMYPHNHRMIRNSEDRFCKTEFDEDDRLLSADLVESGYRCDFIGKWHCGIKRLPTDFGFHGMDVPGYGKCTQAAEYQRYLTDNGLEQGEVIYDGGGWHGNIGLCGTLQGPVEASVPYFLAEETIQQLKNNAAGDEPFVMFSNFWGPHAPYFPVEPFASMYDPKDIETWGNFEETFEGKPNAHKRYRDAFIGPEGRLRTWEECSLWAARYYGFATMIDVQIGRILDELDDLGLAENTTVIFTTDHGDLLGAHGGMHDKASIMCQETYHIPFMVRPPGVSVGREVEVPITNMDLYSTILDIAGVPLSDAVDSRSVVPLISDNGTTDWPEMIVSEFNGHHYHYQSRMVTDGTWKYVFNVPETDELYDLESDPWETTNLAADDSFASQLKIMRDFLIDYCERTEDPVGTWAKNLYRLRKTEYTPYGGVAGASR